MSNISDLKAFLNSVPDKRVAVQLLEALDRIVPTNKDNAVTAHAGGGQASATQLSNKCAFHIVSTVATAADSFALPAAKSGEVHIVTNSAANSAQAFGISPDTIDSVATGTGVPHPPGATVIYACVDDGNYVRIGGVPSSLVAVLAGITATAAEINAAADVSARVVNTTATTLAVTAASHSGKIVKVSSTAPIAVTLPASTGGGDIYTFVLGVAATATPHTIKVANTTDKLAGVSLIAQTDTAQVNGFLTTATDDTITLDGTTKGGLVGDEIVIKDIAAGTFSVRIAGGASGTVATPFSATV